MQWRKAWKYQRGRQSKAVSRRRTYNTMAKRLEIPKGKSEVVNRTEHTMAKSLEIPKE
jgi:hypothetical protein